MLKIEIKKYKFGNKILNSYKAIQKTILNF